VITFVGTGQATGFIHFIIATLLVALLLIIITFLVMMLCVQKQQPHAFTEFNLRGSNFNHFARGIPGAPGGGAPSRGPSRGGPSRAEMRSRQLRAQSPFRPNP